MVYSQKRKSHFMVDEDDACRAQGSWCHFVEKVNPVWRHVILGIDWS